MKTEIAFLQFSLVAIPIVASIVLFRQRMISLMDSKFVPGVFIVRIVCTILFFAPLLTEPAGAATNYFKITGESTAWLIVLGLMLTAVVVARKSSANPSFQKTYPQLKPKSWNKSLIAINLLTWCIYLFGYEYFFRGFLLTQAFPSLDVVDAVIANVALYAFAHVAKNWKEIVLSMPFGLLLCYLTLVTGNLWPAFLIHATLAVSNDLFAISRIGKSSGRRADAFALITGSSAGIGKAIAMEFARMKKNLLLIALPETGLEEVATDIQQKFGVTVHTLSIDLTDAAADSRILEWCRKNHFNVDVLVNNAGFGNLAAFGATRPEVVSSMMALNNSALVRLTHSFIPLLKSNTQSYIMNVGSLASFMPIPKKSLYAATKSFVYTFSQSLYYELAQDNIHVSCLCPGGTLTERVQQSLSQQKLNRTGFCQRPDQVASAGVRGMYNKRFRIIPGWYNRVLYWLSQTLPDELKIQLIKMAFNTNERKPEFTSLSSQVRSIALMNR